VTAYLLDTNQLLFVTQQPERLSQSVIRMLQNPESRLHVSIISFWEIQIKYEARRPDGTRRLPLTGTPENILDYFLKSGSRLLQFLPVHIFTSLTVPVATNDPFDQLLLKQCQVENLQLLTSDARLMTHPLVTQSV
jgi:PIN domain nuclease of toxin-antitoxin system